MTESIIAVVAVAGMIGLALWRPGIAVMAMGVFLFVQSALVRLDTLPNQVASALSRADEIVLAALLVRVTYTWLRGRNPTLHPALWALVAFAAIGVLSAILNGVGPAETGLGIYLATKAGLWLFVGLHLTVHTQVMARYMYLVGALFMGVIGIAALQVIGVSLPWHPTERAGVIAATSIWNFHTAFGGALSVAVGLSVVAFRLPGERIGAAVLIVGSVAGVLLSTARRLLASLTFAAAATLVTLPRGARHYLRSSVSVLRRPAVLALFVFALALGTVVIGPRMVNLAEHTYQRYVVQLTSRDRYLLYEGAVHLVERSPLLGRGPATYGSYASVLVRSPAYAEVGYERPRASMVVGGQIASIFAEYGILGFAAFAAFLGLLVRGLIPIARGSSGTLHAALATGGIFMVTNMVIESIVNPVFSNSFITFFAFTGIGVAMKVHASTTSEDVGVAWDPAALGPRWRLGAIAAAIALLAMLGVVAAVAAQR